MRAGVREGPCINDVSREGEGVQKGRLCKFGSLKGGEMVKSPQNTAEVICRWAP